ncbi:MAG: hypothetical protein NDI90_15475 [Nitrospira sp. BO4]|jgi:hypothetical protein|nr:hypothetical protein [Nitrospira sp. BO4]
MARIQHMVVSSTGKLRLRRAGGFPICDGSKQYPALRRRWIKPWRKTVSKFIAERVKAGDESVMKMIQDLTCEIQTYEQRNFNEWANLTPLSKQQALFRWILDQAKWKKHYRFTAADILAAGIAGDVWTTYGPEPQLRTPYARAANIGHSVRFLLATEWRDYERDNGHGMVTLLRINLTKKVRMRSRNACQRIEAAIKKHAGWFIQKYGNEISQRIQRSQLCGAY